MDIVELTKNIIAQSTGKKYITKKTGRVVIKNDYANGFDSDMAQQWMKQYDKAAKMYITKSKLKNYDKDELLRDTFDMFFTYVKESAIESDRSITSYVFKTMKTIVLKKIIKNQQTVSTDELCEDFVDDRQCIDYTKYTLEDCMRALQNNRFGKRLIEAIMDSSKPVPLTNIDRRVPMTMEEMSDKNSRREICDAWNIIRRIVSRDYMNKEVEDVTMDKIQYSIRHNKNNTNKGLADR